MCIRDRDGDILSVLKRAERLLIENGQPERAKQMMEQFRTFYKMCIRDSIAAVLKTDITKLSFNRTEFADDEDFLSFQKELFAQSLCKTETIPGADRRLLTLVTCSYEWESARTVVILSLIHI